MHSMLEILRHLVVHIYPISAIFHFWPGCFDIKYYCIRYQHIFFDIEDQYSTVTAWVSPSPHARRAADGPETRLAGYKPKRATDQTFSFQCSHDAASPDCAASPRRRRLREGHWKLFIFFARQARARSESALLIQVSGRLRRTSIPRSPIISNFSTSPARNPMLYGCTIYTDPHQLSYPTGSEPDSRSPLAAIWNPVHLDRIRQIGKAQYVLVHTST